MVCTKIAIYKLYMCCIHVYCNGVYSGLKIVLATVDKYKIVVSIGMYRSMAEAGVIAMYKSQVYI